MHLNSIQPIDLWTDYFSIFLADMSQEHRVESNEKYSRESYFIQLVECNKEIRFPLMMLFLLFKT